MVIIIARQRYRINKTVSKRNFTVKQSSFQPLPQLLSAYVNVLDVDSVTHISILTYGVVEDENLEQVEILQWSHVRHLMEGSLLFLTRASLPVTTALLRDRNYHHRPVAQK